MGIIVNFFVFIFISSNITALAQEKYNYTCDYMYSVLRTKEERAFYDALYVNCEIVDNSLGYFEYTPYTSFGNLSMEQAQEITFIFSQDHPEYFWLGSQMRFSTRYGAAYKLVDDFRNGADRKNTKAKIEAAAQKYIDGALEYSTDFERVKYFCDELLKNVSYEFGPWDQTIASVFLQNKTVCEGYSKAFELLCNAVGIDTVIITSYVHAWNAVKIDNHWYLIDVTNNDSSNKYFLISDKKMAEIDEQFGKLIIKNKVGDEDVIYEVYPHEIDYLTYIHYYDDFPECRISYSELSDITIVSILGDANYDGVLNIRDAAYIAIMLASGRKHKLTESADYNEDGKVNIRDAAAIAIYLARK